METTLQSKLSGYVNALRPIIYINHFDYHQVDSLIESVADGAKIYTYTNSGSYAGKALLEIEDKSLAAFLENQLISIDDASVENYRHVFLILKDVHSYFDSTSLRYSPEALSLLKEIAQRTMFSDGVYVTTFIVSPVLVLPKEIEKMITVFDLPYPNSEEVEAVLNDYVTSFNIELSEKNRNELVVSFKGLSEFEIRQILNYAYQKSGTFDEESIRLVLKEKEQIIRKSGIIEIFTTNANMEDIGGLENLKRYLENKAYIYRHLGEARKFGIDLPKGILIVGMPGCGKSLTAKATAAMFNTPLLRLDIGKLMGKYVGESEHNLSAAIKTAEAVAPCVLWIDELEKAFAGVGGIGGGSDITTRLFGQFLTWLQEKESSVYVVATSNDISSLPPEFLRKGRFDELFQVELPTDEERRKIFQIHLKKRGKLTNEVDVLKLIEPTEGYNGADIENVVKETIENAFCSQDDDKSVTTEKLLETIKQTKSISVTLKDKIKDLREKYKAYNLKDANGVVQTQKPLSPSKKRTNNSTADTVRESIFEKRRY